MRYIACRDFKMPPPGSQAGIVDVRAGDIVIGVESWTNPEAWVDSGFVRLALEGEGEKKAPPAESAALVPPKGGRLRVALLEVLEDSKTHTRSALIEIAEAELDDLPTLPNTKGKTIAVLAGLVGIEV